MSRTIEPPNSVVLLVGREQFTPPSTFAGQTCAASQDCLAVGVVSVDDSPTSVTLQRGAETTGLICLGEFAVETEGQLSVRDVYNREYESLEIEPGSVVVTVWSDDDTQPSNLPSLYHRAPSELSAHAE